MSFLHRYDRDERPIARKVMLDLAVYNISTVHAQLHNLGVQLPGDPIAAHEVVELLPRMNAAEQLLEWATDHNGDWPWDNNDFHDFWSLGGDGRELESMTVYISRMPEFYAAIVEASQMPTDYGQALIEGIPQWHN